MHKVHTQFNRLIVEATQRWWVPGCSRRSSLADGSRKHHTLPPAKAGHCEKWLAWVFFNLSEKNPRISQIHEIKTSPPEIFFEDSQGKFQFFPKFHPITPSPTPKLQGQRDQGCRADGKALSDGCCGVSRSIQGIGAAAHFGIEQGHLLAETCIERTGKFKDREIQNGRKQAFSNKKHPKLFKTSTLCRT